MSSRIVSTQCANNVHSDVQIDPLVFRGGAVQFQYVSVIPECCEIKSNVSLKYLFDYHSLKVTNTLNIHVYHIPAYHITHTSFNPVEIFVVSSSKCITNSAFFLMSRPDFISHISIVSGNVVSETKLQNPTSHILQNNGVTIWTLPHKWTKSLKRLCTPLQCAMKLFNP